jgi:hypothetical protein
MKPDTESHVGIITSDSGASARDNCPIGTCTTPGLPKNDPVKDIFTIFPIRLLLLLRITLLLELGTISTDVGTKWLICRVVAERLVVTTLDATIFF